MEAGILMISTRTSQSSRRMTKKIKGSAMSLRENFTCPTLAANVKGKPRRCQGKGKPSLERPDSLLLGADSSERAILPASGRHAARKRLSGAMRELVRGLTSLPESNSFVVSLNLRDWCFRLARQA